MFCAWLAGRFEGSGAPELFLSFETPDEAQTLCGFLRLRLPNCSIMPPADSDTYDDIYTPLRRSTEFSAPLEPGTLRYNLPSRNGVGDSALESTTVETSKPAPAAEEGAILAQQRVRAEERKAAVAAAADGNEVVCAFPELQGCALIRELHVYGKLVVADATAIGPSDTDTESDAIEERARDSERAVESSSQSQHGGFGRRLMARAEQIALEAVRCNSPDLSR